MQVINVLVQYYPLFFQALGVTLKMTVVSLIAATVLGTFSVFLKCPAWGFSR